MTDMLSAIPQMIAATPTPLAADVFCVIVAATGPAAKVLCAGGAATNALDSSASADVSALAAGSCCARCQRM